MSNEIFRNIRYRNSIYPVNCAGQLMWFSVTASCDNEVQNNLTYVTSPGFPNLIDRPMNCTVVVRKIDTEVSQLRIDFVHFNIVSFREMSHCCDVIHRRDPPRPIANVDSPKLWYSTSCQDNVDANTMRVNETLFFQKPRQCFLIEKSIFSYCILYKKMVIKYINI